MLKTPELKIHLPELKILKYIYYVAWNFGTTEFSWKTKCLLILSKYQLQLVHS